MKNLQTSFRILCLTAGILLSSLGANGLESDRNQNIMFNSDGGTTMSIRGDLRIIEMKDNVKVTQGSLQIFGNSAVFEYKTATGELNQVTVHGNPVRYQQQLNAAGNLVTGTSETILFYTNEIDGETILELIGDANIQSPDSTMRCASITYLADQDFIRETKGPCEGVLNSQSNPGG